VLSLTIRWQKVISIVADSGVMDKVLIEVKLAINTMILVIEKFCSRNNKDRVAVVTSIVGSRLRKPNPAKTNIRATPSRMQTRIPYTVKPHFIKSFSIASTVTKQCLLIIKPSK